MKTQEEIHNLLEAIKTITKELNNAINTENSNDRMVMAMMLIPLLPTIDEFMATLKKDVNDTEEEKSSLEEEKSSSEDQLNNPFLQVKSNGTPS